MGDFLDKTGLARVKSKIDGLLSGKISVSQKGTANGVAELNANGHVPASQLPSFVDDVIEYAGSENFPTTGEPDKIYVDTLTGLTYRWSGSMYVEVSKSVALGETSATAYRGDRGKIAYDHASAKGSAFETGLYKITTNAEGHVTSAAAVIKSDITDLGVPGDAITNITRSGTTFTATKSDGTTFTFDQQDNDTQLTKMQVVDMVYPVGSIYMSVSSTSPATLFGGTWVQLKDRFLLGAGDTYTNGATGGVASITYTPAGTNSGGAVSNHTLTVAQIPSHNHSFTGSAVTSGGISANHTHTGTSGNPSANHTHSGPSHTHDLATANNWTSKGTHAVAKTDKTANTTASDGAKAAGTGATGTVSAWHTHTTTTGNQSAGHTHSVTAAGTIGNKGDGGAHNHGFTQPTFKGTAATISTMSPYLVVYMWKRTA